MMCAAQDDDPSSHRGTQFATTGTDFWVCFPRTMRGMSRNASRLYVVSERDCDVTVENEWLGYSQTYYLPGHEPRPYYEGIPEPRHDYSGTSSDLPQFRGFHVTSTDTVALFIYVASSHFTGCSVLPTEMLRDEYIALPPVANHHLQGLNIPTFFPHLSNLDGDAEEGAIVPYCSRRSAR